MALDIEHPTFTIDVVKHGSNNYKVTITFSNPTTTRKLKKEFIIHIANNTKEKERWNEDIVTGAVMKYMYNQSRIRFLNISTKREKGLGVYQILKQYTKRRGSDSLLQTLETEGKEYNTYDKQDPRRALPFNGGREKGKKHAEGKGTIDDNGDERTGSDEEFVLVNPGEKVPLPPQPQPQPQPTSGEGGREDDKYESPIIEEARTTIERKAISTPQSSIFKPEETGATFAMIGKSKSGKTTFVVNQLNRMTEKEVEGYNAIVYFTTSLNANPLKELAPHVKKRMILVGRFVPKILQTMKRINDETKNQFRFLVIFDDILKLRGDILSECILTLRNSNISTVISMQYVKLMSPAQRDSVHNLYIFNLKTELWEFMLRGFILGNVKEEIPALRPIKRVSEVALVMRQVMGPFIIYHDQVNDTTDFYNKET